MGEGGGKGNEGLGELKSWRRLVGTQGVEETQEKRVEEPQLKGKKRNLRKKGLKSLRKRGLKALWKKGFEGSQ